MNTAIQSEYNTKASNPEQWVDQHGDVLYRFALLRVRNRERAEEVVQETFLAALQSRNRFEGQSSERTWLIGILKHKIIDQFRKHSREVPLEEPDHETDHEDFRTTGEWIGHWTQGGAPTEWGASPAQLTEQKEFWVVLNRCLATLPPRLAQVFILRELDELDSAEVCRIIQISESNLWVMLHRARAQLRHALELQYFRPRKDV